MRGVDAASQRGRKSDKLRLCESWWKMWIGRDGLVKLYKLIQKWPKLRPEL